MKELTTPEVIVRMDSPFETLENWKSYAKRVRVQFGFVILHRQNESTKMNKFHWAVILTVTEVVTVM